MKKEPFKIKIKLDPTKLEGLKHLETKAEPVLIFLNFDSSRVVGKATVRASDKNLIASCELTDQSVIDSLKTFRLAYALQAKATPKGASDTAIIVALSFVNQKDYANN